MRKEPALRFPGVQHLQADTVLPRAFVEAPIYHLDLLRARRAYAPREGGRLRGSPPGTVARGGGRFNEAFYLPELRESVVLREAGDEDAALIAAVLDPPDLPAPPAESARVPLVSLDETDRDWERRPVGAAAYAATLDPRERAVRVLPGEHVEVLVRVRNGGDAVWPWSLDHHPQIRLGHRWLDATGEQVGEEGARSPFPKAVQPGERLLAPVAVVAPATPGAYSLEVDVVHEHVRWFGAPCRLDVEVTPQAALPPAGERLRVTARGAVGERPRRDPGSARAPVIPRIIHRIWLGDGAMPPEHEHYGEGFARLHPGWEQRLWTDEQLAELGIGPQLVGLTRTKSELSNLVRYEVLARHGGVYVDTDVECRKPLDGLLEGVEAFAALELPGRLGTAVLGCAPGHALFARAAVEARTTAGIGASSTDANGPLFFSLLAEQERGLTIFGPELFYPYLWTEPERRDEDFPGAYAVHHWALSWIAETRPGGA